MTGLSYTMNQSSESAVNGRNFMSIGISLGVGMARDSSQLLGAKQLAGAGVNPRGFAWKHVASSYVGPAAKKIVKENTSQTPRFPRTAFLAVTDREVALLTIERGGWNGRLGEVLARVPRSDVASAKVSPGVLRTNLTISFTDGGSWEFEVSPLIRHTVVRVVRALGY
jgi:hypothetical protein